MTRGLIGAVLAAALVAGCGAATGPTPVATAATLVETARPTPTPKPTATPDQVLAGAVTDALASMDEIIRLYGFTEAGPSSVDASLMAHVASSERASLATMPARITTMPPFHALDLIMQIFELAVVTGEPADLMEGRIRIREWRPVIAALAP